MASTFAVFRKRHVLLLLNFIPQVLIHGKIGKVGNSPCGTSGRDEQIGFGTYNKAAPMRYCKPPTPLALDSALSPEECVERIRDAIDRERRTFFGWSGYRGSKPFVGEVDGSYLRLIQRIYRMRNSFQPVLTAEFQPHCAGTRVNGTFDLELTSKIAICLLSACGVLVVGMIVLISYASHPVLSVISFSGYCTMLFFLPKYFREVGTNQERSIADFLKVTLEANEVSPRSRA